MRYVDVRGLEPEEKVEAFFTIKSGELNRIIYCPLPANPETNPQAVYKILPKNPEANTVVVVENDAEARACELIYYPRYLPEVEKEHKKRWALSKEYQDSYVKNQHWWNDYYREKYRDQLRKKALEILGVKEERKEEVKPVQPQPTQPAQPTQPQPQQPQPIQQQLTKEQIIQVLDEVMPYIIARVTGKPLHKSKTIWANLLALITFLASVINPYIDPATKQAILNAFAPLLALINIWLRFKTWQPIR